MTKAQAARRWDRIIKQCYRDMAGGTQYGIDMPTLRATWPDRFAELVKLERIMRGIE